MSTKINTLQKPGAKTLGALLLVLGMVVAACGSGDVTGLESNSAVTEVVSDTTAVTSADNSSDETSEPAPDAVPPSDEAQTGLPVSYSFAEYESFVYNLDITQDVQVGLDDNTGLAALFSRTYDLTNELEGTLTYQPGVIDEQGLLPIRIVSDFTEGKVEGTIDGDPFMENLGEYTEDLGIGEIPPIDVTIVVDEKGAVHDILPADKELEPIAEAVLGNLGDFSGLGNEHFIRPLGPSFPDYQITAGDTWTEQIVLDGPSGPLITNANHTLTQVIEGESDVLVGQSVFTTDGYRLDLSQLLRDLFGAFAGGQEVEEATESSLSVGLDIGETIATVNWNFDSDSGLVESGTLDMQTSLTSAFDLDQSDSDTVKVGATIDQHTVFSLDQPSS